VLVVGSNLHRSSICISFSISVLEARLLQCRRFAAAWSVYFGWIIIIILLIIMMMIIIIDIFVECYKICWSWSIAVYCLQVLLKSITSHSTWKTNCRSCRAVKILSDSFRKLSETLARCKFCAVYIYCITCSVLLHVNITGHLACKQSCSNNYQAGIETESSGSSSSSSSSGRLLWLLCFDMVSIRKGICPVKNVTWEIPEVSLWRPLELLPYLWWLNKSLVCVALCCLW